MDEDEHGNPWVSTPLLQFRLYALPSLQMSTGYLARSYDESVPFRKLFTECLNLRPNPLHDAFINPWDRFEDRIRRAIRNADERKLVNFLEIDYFLHPEDAPYLVPSHWFREAATLNSPAALFILFHLDPHSLPWQDVQNRRWAQHARIRMQSYLEERQESRLDLRQQRLDGYEFTSLDLQNLWKERHYQDWLHEQDRNLVRYVNTGKLYSKPDQYSPTFLSYSLPILDDSIVESTLFAGDDEDFDFDGDTPGVSELSDFSDDATLPSFLLEDDEGYDPFDPYDGEEENLFADDDDLYPPFEPDDDPLPRDRVHNPPDDTELFTAKYKSIDIIAALINNVTLGPNDFFLDLVEKGSPPPYMR